MEKQTVILGVTGSIAAYKAADLASRLAKEGYNVQVIMTKNALQFLSPITFESLTGNKCLVDTFDRNFQFQIAHVSLAQRAAACCIAPASANIIAKLACGIADDMLSTTVLACQCPKWIAPAMNTNMYRNPIVQDNLEKLQHYGFGIIPPATGMLACKTVGEGKLAPVETIYDYLQRELYPKKDLAGIKILVTAGPTQEALDPVRCLTNHSSGKMGYALAKRCMLRGAQVTLVSGPCALEPPRFVNVIPVTTAQEMMEAVQANYADMDMIFKAAAVADYTPAQTQTEKMKKGQDKEETLALPLRRTPDILQYLGGHKKDGQFLCGFSMETQNLEENSRKKLVRKKADMIVANSLNTQGAGFQSDTNIVTLITQDASYPLEKMTKEEVAEHIIDESLRQWRRLFRS